MRMPLHMCENILNLKLYVLLNRNEMQLLSGEKLTAFDFGNCFYILKSNIVML